MVDELVAEVAATSMTPCADAGDALADRRSRGSLLLAVPVAVIAGLVSFASPCVLPLVPALLWRT